MLSKIRKNWDHLGRKNGSITLENNLVVPWKGNQKATFQPAVAILGFYLREMKKIGLHKILYTHVNSRIIHNSQNTKTIYMSINWWKSKQYVVYPYNEILFSNKWNNVLIHSTMWMELKNIMLNERSQVQKTIYCMISFRWNVKKRHFYNGRNLISDAQDWRWEQEPTAQGRRVFYGVMKCSKVESWWW